MLSLHDTASLSDRASRRKWLRASGLSAVGLSLLVMLSPAASAAEKPTQLIGYTEGRNDLEGGQFVNWVTNRACVVSADGKGRKILAEELTKNEHTWTQFAGWSPDGKQAVVLSLWESPENAAWERKNKTFRMTEGWLVDSCLLDLATNKVTNLTAVDRVSIYNTGLFFLPAGKGFGFTPLIKGGHFPSADSGADGFVGTAPVKSFPANGYGLHDMSGNVWEWCSDWYRSDYYRNSPEINPIGPTTGELDGGQAQRVRRGGSYLCAEGYCGAYLPSARDKNPEDSSACHCGFRCVADE